MSSRTSPSAPLGSWPGWLTAPSTLAAVTEGTGEAQPGEVGIEVAAAESAAELDDRDGLPGAVGARRELVQRARPAAGCRRWGPRPEPGHPAPVRWVPVRAGCRTGGRGCGGRWCARAGPGGRCVADRCVAELRPGLRPVIQAQHREHDAVQFGGNLQPAFPVPVLDRALPRDRIRRAHQAQRGAEGGGHARERARDLDPAGARVGADDRQAVGGQHGRDEAQVGGVGAVLLGQLLPGEDGWPLDQILGQRRPAPGHQRHLDLLGIIHRAEFLRLAAVNRARCRAKARRNVPPLVAPLCSLTLSALTSDPPVCRDTRGRGAVPVAMQRALRGTGRAAAGTVPAWDHGAGERPGGWSPSSAGPIPVFFCFCCSSASPGGVSR